MGAARKRPTIYRLSDVQPVHRKGRRKLYDDEELSRLRIEIGTEVMQEVCANLIGAKVMTADELLRQLADRLREV